MEVNRKSYSQHASRTISAAHMPTQRDLMRDLFRHHRGNEDAIVAAYAAAEARGEVARASNAYDLSPEECARRLLEDARKKGWISGFR
jgi:hypothetical protein